MSGHRRKGKNNLDYNILHKTGARVLKGKEHPGNNMENLVDKKLQELLINEDINEIFKTYDINELDTIDELNESIEHVAEVGKTFRHIHVELRSVMSEKEYENNYNDFQNTIDKIRSFIKDAKEKLKKAKMEEEEKVKKAEMEEKEKIKKAKLEVEEKLKETKIKEKEEEEEKLKRSLKIEEEVFRERLTPELEPFQSSDMDEIKENCDRLELLRDEYFKLLSKVKIVFGQEYEGDLSSIFNSTIAQINQQIKTGRLKIRELKDEMVKTISLDKAGDREIAHKDFMSEQKFHADNLSREIELRCKELVKSAE